MNRLEKLCLSDKEAEALAKDIEEATSLRGARRLELLLELPRYSALARTRS